MSDDVVVTSKHFMHPAVERFWRDKIAAEIEELRDRHFARHGNEETGPRNYDWALTHAARIARGGAPDKEEMG